MITVSRGAQNYLQDVFHLNGVEQMRSADAARLLEGVEVEPEAQCEDRELWLAYCHYHNLDMHQSGMKFRYSKFYREHM